MDMSQSTRKWSELHGIAVISVADGKKIGTWDDFYFDPITQSVTCILHQHIWARRDYDRQ